MKSILNSLPVFVAAAEANSFSQTAKKLHLTRSSVAKKIAQLEARLGVTLFHRTTRTQSLTEEGMLYYEYCRRALDEIEKIEDILDSGIAKRLNFDYIICFKNRSSRLQPISIFLRFA